MRIIDWSSDVCSSDLRTSSPFYAGKIDAVIVDGQRLEFTYFNTSGTTVRNIYNAYNPETNMSGPYSSTQLFEYGGENYVGRYTGQFTDWLTISAAYGKNKKIGRASCRERGCQYV